MSFRKNTRALVEAALMVAITCIFGIVGTYIPLLAFILFFIPIPFIILGKRHGIRFVILSIIASTAIVGSFTTPTYPVFVVLFPGITAAVMGYMMNKGYAPSKVLLGGTVASIASSVLSMALTSVLVGISTMDQLGEMFQQIIDMQVRIYEGMGADTYQIEEVRKNLEAITQAALMVIPAAVVLSSAFLTYLNYVIAIRVLNRIGYQTEKLPPVQHFRLSKSFLMGTFLIIALTILIKNLNIVHYETLVSNIFVIFQFIYFVQGLAVISFYMTAFRVHRLLQGIIFLFLLLNQFAFFAASVLGFLDAFINFRKLKTDG